MRGSRALRGPLSVFYGNSIVLVQTLAIVVPPRRVGCHMATQDERGPGVHVSVRLPTEMHAQLRDIAEREHRTVSQEVRRLIDIRLAEFNQPEAA